MDGQNKKQKEWIVLGERDGKIKLVSNGEIGILPKGSFLTVEDDNAKFVLRVDDSKQSEPYTPSILIAEMGMTGLIADRKCVNEITAYRVKDLSFRDDGMVDFIHPHSRARLSTQEEIDAALESQNKGARVFISTIHSNQNRILRDQCGKRISVCLPDDIFWHQIMVCGKTGSGKTVSMKYLAQYFLEEMDGAGAVLAVNVKEKDFMQMDRPSNNINEDIISEWNDIGIEAKGLDNVTMYIPANRNDVQKGVNRNLCKKVTLNVKEIDPFALTGVLQGISDKGALLVPGIFNYWRAC